jgi:hypothetical protein
MAARFFHSLFDRVQSAGDGAQEKTFLIVDNTPAEDSLAFCLEEERCIVLDGRKLHFDRTMKRKPLRLILEDARLVLLNAMIHGKTVVLRLKDVCLDVLTMNDEHCLDLDPVAEHFPPFGKISYLPACWLLRSGHDLRREEWHRAIIHRTDFGKTQERPPCHPRFSVVVTTTTPLSLLDERLFRSTIGLPPPRQDNFRVIEWSGGEWDEHAEAASKDSS